MTGPRDMQRERPTVATSPGVRPEVIKDLDVPGDDDLQYVPAS
jgi:hypothetical protein